MESHTCSFCGRIGKSKSSNSNHQVRCPENPNRKLQKLTEDGRRRLKESVRIQHNNQWTEDRRKRHSESMKKAVIDNPDSYTKNNVCGRVKIVEYNGVKLKGQWELKTAKWLDNNNIVWENEANPQNYIWNGGWHMYFPDFYLPKYDAYIEVKGYKTERDDAKWSQFKGMLIIVDSTIIGDLDEYDINDLIEQRVYSSAV